MMAVWKNYTSVQVAHKREIQALIFIRLLPVQPSEVCSQLIKSFPNTHDRTRLII